MLCDTDSRKPEGKKKRVKKKYCLLSFFFLGISTWPHKHQQQQQQQHRKLI